MNKVDWGFGIQSFDPVVPEVFCKDLIGQFVRQPIDNTSKIAETGTELDGKLANYREADTLYMNRNPDWSDRLSILQKLINPFIAGYIGEYAITEDQVNDTGFELVHYRPGKQCHPHRDAGPHQLRMFASFTLTLNQPKDGGELEFLEHKIIVPPKTGQLVIFPAAYTYPHRVNPSTDDRFAIVSFLRYGKWTL